jgi:hypothetical protein
MRGLLCALLLLVLSGPPSMPISERAPHFISLANSLTLKIEAVCLSETSAHFYQTTRRHIPLCLM